MKIFSSSWSSCHHWLLEYAVAYMDLLISTFFPPFWSSRNLWQWLLKWTTRPSDLIHMSSSLCPFSKMNGSCYTCLPPWFWNSTCFSFFIVCKICLCIFDCSVCLESTVYIIKFLSIFKWMESNRRWPMRRRVGRRSLCRAQCYHPVCHLNFVFNKILRKSHFKFGFLVFLCFCVLTPQEPNKPKFGR
jgi:hypothetical protein